MEWLLAILAVLGYPFIAALIVGAGRNRRIEALEHEVEALRKSLRELVVSTSAPPSASPPVTPAAKSTQPQAFSPSGVIVPQPAPPDAVPPVASAPPVPEVAAARAAHEEAAAHEEEAAPAEAGQPAPAPAPVPEPAAAPHPWQQPAQPAQSPKSAPRPAPEMPAWLQAARTWLFTGNLVAKLGLVILFIGIAFLLKYVAATVDIPIELRLAGVVLADLPLLAWGWRLRTKRRDIGLPVQGTAIAIMMLVVFGAYQRYALIPGSLAFAMLVALTAFACVLALLQNAVWLAVFGITGGFACPLLVSSGSGNHIGLFSYYALLNAGVFAIALRRSWRVLNLLGFAFTFVVGAAWGGLRYTPDNYLSAQAFLILFFLYYVGISLAYARRQQVRLKDYVDATLVLGTPLLAFGLQIGLVKGKEFGLAWSALALGGFYLGLATLLWRQGRERWRTMVETIGAIGIIFATLTIPFALDGRWTSGVWALEGAGFVWFGLKRQQARAWIFGLVLQVGAWIGFLSAVSGLDPVAAAESNLWLGFLLLAGSAFAVASDFRRHADGKPGIAMLATGLLTIAAVWLLAGSWTEALLRLDGSLLANVLAISALVTAGVLYVVASRLAWPVAYRLGLAAQIAAALGLAWVAGIEWNWFEPVERHGDKPALGALLIALSAFASSRMLERQAAESSGKPVAPMLLWWAGFWWFGPVLNIMAGRLAMPLPDSLGSGEPRWIGVYALAVALSAVLSVHLAARLQWDRLRWLGATCWAMLALVTVQVLALLYSARELPLPAIWLGWAFLWAGSEFLLARWPAATWERAPVMLRALHALRTGGPWLALWPACAILIGNWLAGGQAGVEEGEWIVGGAWSNYLPTWAMMAVLAWLMRQSATGAWPTRPLAAWYRTLLIPCAVGLLLALCATWNVFQDGGMAPLPYLPLLNPLDLTTGFVLVLAVGAARLRARDAADTPAVRRKLLVAWAGAAWLWFNLILLRSAAHYLGIDYRLDALASSQFVSAMLSLAWSASALVLMRVAARRAWRRAWSAGAILIGIVVAKLFLADLANHGSIARVVSFVGVGVLMLLVGYLAPFPKSADAKGGEAGVQP